MVSFSYLLIEFLLFLGKCLLFVRVEHFLIHLFGSEDGHIVCVGDFDHFMECANSLERVGPLLVQVSLEHVCALWVAGTRRLDRGVNLGVAKLDVLVFEFIHFFLEAVMFDLQSQLVKGV